MPSCRSRRPGRTWHGRTRRTVAPLAAAALVAALALLGAGGSVAGAQEPTPAPVPACAGVVVDATVAAASVPGGAWSVADTCVPPEAVYETDFLGYRLVGGLGVATYTDGHLGRIAFLTARVAPDRALTLVGVEDQATGQVTWAYADGPAGDTAGVRATGGPANAATIPAGGVAGPVESAEVQLSIEGAGTDLATATGTVPDQLRAFLDQAAAALTR